MPALGPNEREYVEERLRERPDEDVRKAGGVIARWLGQRLWLWLCAGGGLGLGGWNATRAPSADEVAAPVNATARQVEELDAEVRRLRRLVYRLQDSALVRRDSAEWRARVRRELEGREASPPPAELPRL